MNDLIFGLGMLLQVLAFLILARALISWFPIDRSGPVVRALDQVTDPVLEPLRRVIPPIGMIDITPLVAMIFLSVAAGILMDSAQS